VVIYLNKLKLFALRVSPMVALGSLFAVNSTHAQIIPTASSTAIITSVSTNVWDVFAANFPLVVGVVVLFTIVIALATWLLSKIGGIGRHK